MIDYLHKFSKQRPLNNDMRLDSMPSADELALFLSIHALYSHIFQRLRRHKVNHVGKQINNILNI